MSYFRPYTSYQTPKCLEITFTEGTFHSVKRIIQGNPGFFVDFASRRNSDQFRSTLSCTCYTDKWPELLSSLLQKGYMVRQPAFNYYQHHRNVQREIRDMQDPLYSQYGRQEDQNEA